jgi:hypothetical protein
MGEMTVTREMLAAKFGSIFPHLDERQRRLLLGAEARVLGHGGIKLVARAAEVREATVSLGVAELESGAEPLGRARRGVTISNAQMDALPITRHDWHGDWNYTLHPQPAAQPAPPRAAAPPRPAAARPRPDLAWLTHPAITGMPGPALDALTAALTGPAAALREAALDRRRGYRPRQIAPGTGRRPQITLTRKLLAVILHDRHGLPREAIAALYHIRPEDLSRHTSGVRRLLHQTGHTIQPAPRNLATLDDLYRHAAEHGIPTQAKINTAC